MRSMRPKLSNGTIALAKEVNSKGYNYLYMANPDNCHRLRKLRYCMSDAVK